MEGEIGSGTSAGQERSGDGSKEWRLIEKTLLGMEEEHRKQRRWGVVFKLLGFGYLILVTLPILVFAFGSGGEGKSNPVREDHVGFVDLYGMIASEADANADALTTGLRRAFEAENSVAVVLRVNSPGGSPVQSDLVYREIRRLREEHPEKKIYAVITDVGASGAYYIASAANEIYANEASIVGSIGVIAQGFGFTQLLDKVGVERRVFSSGDNKSMLDPFAELSTRQVKHFEGVLGQVHEQFKTSVREGRGDRLKQDDDIFSGLFWTGVGAMDLGLVDGLMSPGQVAREVVGVEEFVDYTWRPDPISEFVKLLGVSMGEGLGSLGLNLSEGGYFLR